tara:strand:- start:76036 stop:76776 length:741 start_codon:yes stop_codon:yes gene_type:complete
MFQGLEMKVDDVKSHLRDVNFNKQRIVNIETPPPGDHFKVTLEDINGKLDHRIINKINLGELRDVDKFIVSNYYDTTNELLEELNELYDFNLRLDDIVIEPITSKEFVLKFKDTSLYTGDLKVEMRPKTESIIRMMDGQFESVIKLKTVDSDPKYLTRHLSFDYLRESLKELQLADSLSTQLINGVLASLPDWECVPELREKNLYGALVSYNGSHDLKTKPETMVLKLKLNPKYCRSYSGELELYY